MILLDTHVWLWWINAPGRLSSRAAGAIANAVGSSGVRISTMSAWEVAMLATANRLVLDRDVRDWVAASEQLPFITFVPIDTTIAISSVLLPEPLHKDPADRLIAATAIALGLPLVTADQKLLDYPHLQPIW